MGRRDQLKHSRAWYREKLWDYPLFGAAGKIASHLTFSWFWNLTNDLYGKETASVTSELRKNGLDRLAALAQNDVEIRLWCYYLRKVFKPDIDDNVRPLLLPGYDGITANLPSYAKALNALDRLPQNWSVRREKDDWIVRSNPRHESRLDLDRSLALARRTVRGPVTDIDEPILLLLFDALHDADPGTKDLAFHAELSQAFPSLVNSSAKPANYVATAIRKWRDYLNDCAAS